MSDQENQPADQQQDSNQQPENAAEALLGGKLAEAMPAVDTATISGHQTTETAKSAENQQQPAAEPAKQAAQAASKTALVDSYGRTFNPLLHEVDSNGQPVLRKGTNVLKCRRVPLKGAREESRVELGDAAAPAADQPQQQQAPDQQQQQQPAPDPAKMEAMQRAGAATMAGLQIQLMKLALGEHTASSKEEAEALTECWRETFAYYGMGAMHPLLGLSIITGAITMKSIQHPEGQSKWQRIKLWVRMKVGGMMLWFGGKKKPRAEEPEKEEKQAA